MRIRDSILMLSIQEDSLRMMNIALFLGADPNHVEEDSYLPEKTSALKDALQYGGKNGEKMALRLIEKGAQINHPLIKDNLLYTAVHHIDNPHLVEKMVKYGGNLMKGDGPLGRPPMLEALVVGHLKSAQKLLDLGTPIDITDANGKTALMETAIRGQHDVIEYLLTNGAEINKKDNFGETVAHHIVESIGPKQSEKTHKEQLKTLRILKEAGADFFLPNNKGETAFALARKTKIADVPEFRPFFTKMFQETSVEWKKNDGEKRQQRIDYTKRKQQERDL